MIESIHKYNMKTEEYKMFKIRNEIETDYKIVEDVTRKAFYNVYSPGCMEHYLVHVMRGHEDFVPECLCGGRKIPGGDVSKRIKGGGSGREKMVLFRQSGDECRRKGSSGVR